MPIEFTPQNLLEKAIHAGDTQQLMQAVAEEEVLSRLVPAAWLENEVFSDEMVFSVLLLSLPRELLKKMDSDWFYHRNFTGARLKKLVQEALAPLPGDPVEQEKALIKSIVYGDDHAIEVLIREEKCRFQGFAPELLTFLPKLQLPTVKLLLQEGLSAKLKAIVLGILLGDVEKNQILSECSYEQRMEYANLMLQIVFKKK